MPGEIVLEPLPFQEAIDYFADKVPLTKKELKKLAKEAQKKAFTVAVEQKMQAITGVKAAITKALEDGTTMQEFRKNVNDLFNTLGVSPMGKFHAETVFRTNIQTAYSVGRYQRQTHPDVLAERPYLEYDAVEDEDITPLCESLNGKVYPADHSFWDTYYPPNHFRCRSRVNSVSKWEVEKEGLKVEKEVPAFMKLSNGGHAPLVPGKGFEKNPANTAGYEPDWSKYPEELRRQAGVN